MQGLRELTILGIIIQEEGTVCANACGRGMPGVLEEL